MYMHACVGVHVGMFGHEMERTVQGKRTSMKHECCAQGALKCTCLTQPTPRHVCMPFYMMSSHVALLLFLMLRLQLNRREAEKAQMERRVEHTAELQRSFEDIKKSLRVRARVCVFVFLLEGGWRGEGQWCEAKAVNTCDEHGMLCLLHDHGGRVCSPPVFRIQLDFFFALALLCSHHHQRLFSPPRPPFANRIQRPRLRRS